MATTATTPARKQLKFSDPTKQKVYDHLLKYPGSNYTSYQIKSNDPALSESEFNEVLRAMRVAELPDEFGDGDGFGVSASRRAPTEKENASTPSAPAAGEKDMTSENPAIKSASAKSESGKSTAPSAEAQKGKRGRPKGSKQVAAAGEVKPKGKRGRPKGSVKTAKAFKPGKDLAVRFKPGKELRSRADFPGKASGEKSAASGKTGAGKKGAGQGRRYSEDRQNEIVAFITSQGRGGLTQARDKFGVSYPTLIRWVNEAGPSARAASKKKAEKPGSTEVKVPGKRGRPRKSDSLGAGAVKVPGKRGRPRKVDALGAGGEKTSAKNSGPKNSGHVLISKKVLQEFRKGLANLEAAFGAFSNAIRVLE